MGEYKKVGLDEIIDRFIDEARSSIEEMEKETATMNLILPMQIYNDDDKDNFEYQLLVVTAVKIQGVPKEPSINFYALTEDQYLDVSLELRKKENEDMLVTLDLDEEKKDNSTKKE